MICRGQGCLAVASGGYIDEPKCGGRREVVGSRLSQWVQLYTGAQITYRLYDSAPYPPHSLQQVVPLSQSSCVLPVALADKRGERGAGAKLQDHEKQPNLVSTHYVVSASRYSKSNNWEMREEKIFKMRRSYFRSEKVSYRGRTLGRNKEKILKSFHPATIHRLLYCTALPDNYIFSHSRNLLQFLEFIFCTLWRKRIENHIPFRLV
jgi:hypothetical protein